MIPQRLLFAVILAILLATPTSAFAQDATPTGGNAPGLGQAVTIPGASGEEIATITVTEVQDPFELYLPSNPPAYGYHFVLVTITVENSGTRPFRFDPRTVSLQDTDGFVSTIIQVRRPDDATQALDLTSQDLSVGGKNSGVVGFQILNTSTLARALYSPNSGQNVEILDFGAASPNPVSESTTVLGTDLSEIASVTVEEIIDPFEAYADNSVPARGNHYVMARVAVTNSGPRALTVDPRAFTLQDGEGFLYVPVNIQQTEDGSLPALERLDLLPGETATGAVGYLVINGVDLDHLLWQPSADRMIVLADLSS